MGERWFRPLDDARHPVDEHWSVVEGQVVVRGILECLPSHMQQVLQLRVFAGEPDAVSAASMGISLDAFRCRYKRALSAARSAAQGLGIEGAAAVIAAPALSLGRHVRRGLAQVGSAVSKLSDAGVRLLALPGVDTLGMATIALVTSAAVGPAARGFTAQLPSRPVATTATLGRALPAVAPPATSTDPAHEMVSVSSGQSGTAPPGLGPITGHLPGAQASQETTDDSHLYSATPAPRQSDWIVALGWGQRCSCTVVFQSANKGATWAAAPGPALDSGTAAQVSLPPQYPSDPRIFISGPAQLGSPSYIADRFGDAFLPLPVPSGTVAVSPTLDSGDDRIFIAGVSTAWTYQLTTHVLQPVLTDQAISQVYGIASPLTGAPLLFLVGATTSPLSGKTTTLFACNSATLCTTVTTLPLSMADGVAISPRYATDHTLAVSWLNGFAVSTDRGQHFDMVALPVGVRLTATAFLTTPATGDEIWATVQAAGRTVMVHTPLDATHWQAVLAGSSDPAVLTAAVAGQRVLAVLSAGGVACSDDDGATWERACAARTAAN
jgi:hypothetical protein